jgi:VCBS repeat-containing protein
VTAETVVTVTAAQTLYAHWTVQSIVHVKGADGAMHDGIVTVKGADGAMHVGIVYVKGPDGNLHVNG